MSTWRFLVTLVGFGFPAHWGVWFLVSWSSQIRCWWKKHHISPLTPCERLNMDIYMDRISRAESRKVDQWHIHDHFMWICLGQLGPQWHDQKLKPEIQHRPFINWARYLSSIPRCYAASPWTTVQPVARQIGHGTANRAGPLRQRKRARSCLELCENHHEISWTLERWQFIDVNHMIRSVFCPMKGIVLQHRAWTCS